MLTKEVEKYFLHEIMLYVNCFLRDMMDIKKNLDDTVMKNFNEDIKPNAVKKSEMQKDKDEKREKKKHIRTNRKKKYSD